MRRLFLRLEPQSPEGDVYRDDLVEVFERIFDVALTLIAAFGVLASVAQSEWGQAAIFAMASLTMLLIARRFFFRPHLVLGRDVLILVGAIRTRRLPMRSVRKAVAESGALKLVLIDGEEIYVPGHFLWWYARGDHYRGLAGGHQ